MNYTYCGITADAALWRSLGMTAYSNTPFEQNPNRDSYDAPSYGELIEARVSSGSDGDAALVWLIQERRRRREEQARIESERKAGDDAIHAARIRRQAAELECLARGVQPKAEA